MSRAGAFGLLLIVLAASGFSLLLTPGLHGLIASAILFACWLLLVTGSVVERRGRV